MLEDYFEKVLNKDDNPILLLELVCKKLDFDIGSILTNDKTQLAFYDKNLALTTLVPIFTEILNYELLSNNSYYFRGYNQKNGIILPGPLGWKLGISSDPTGSKLTASSPVTSSSI